MKNNYRTSARTEAHIKQIEGQIRGAVAQLYTLSPDGHGPAFISLNSAFKPAAEYDGMLGSLMIDSFLGTVFAEAALNDNNAVTAIISSVDNNALEMAAEFVEERSEDHKDDKTHNNFGRGRGSIALCERMGSKPAFNLHADADPSLHNQGPRQNLESHIAALQRKVESLKATHGLTLAA